VWRGGRGGPAARVILRQHRLDLVDQGFQPLGRAGPLRQICSELVGALADLQDRRIDLVGGGLLLLGGEQ
jgi:hypothetical protein